METTYDYVIIGSGIAGLSLAIKLSKYGKVVIITKSNEDESNTKYAQGGVAVVSNLATDSFHKHIQDTIIAGDFGSKLQVVEAVVKEAPERMQEIIAWGAQFDQNEKGFFDLAQEGGHSEARVVHHKDITGFEIERALLATIYRTQNITLLTHTFAIDLITEHHLGKEITKKTTHISCFGVYVLNSLTQKIDTILGKQVILATGGAGHVYQTTTNPSIATGDGIAMTYRAKGKVANMEFIQFHPTSLFNPNENPSFLISEAVRGYGAVLKNKLGQEFMHQYDKRRSLAPRDIVARAIDAEMKKTGDEFVLLDCRHLTLDFIKKHIPNIYQKCKSIGIDLTKDMIPVVPAMHYLVGGILVDLQGKTSIDNLFACGECSHTGLHGANRLASNSLIEALVFSHRIFEAITQNPNNRPHPTNIPDWNDDGTKQPEEKMLITQNIKELQMMMSSYMGIVRNNQRIDRAMNRLKLIHEETERLYQTSKLSVKLLELRNLVAVAYTIIKCAKQRTESRGLHYNTDYPFKSENFTDTII